MGHQHQYRVWVGAEGRSLKRGPICESLEEALGRAYHLAESYAVRIELGRQGWHVFSENKSTLIGPNFRREKLPTVNSKSPMPERPRVSRSRTASVAPITRASGSRMSRSRTASVAPINRASGSRRTPKERRRGHRVGSPLLFVEGFRASWCGRPVRVVDMSWIGARLELGTTANVQVGEVLELQVEGPNTAVTMRGEVKWARRGECGIAFVQSSMGLDSATVLERILAAA